MISPGGAQLFSGAGFDQFGGAMSPASSFNWSVNAGGAMAPLSGASSTFTSSGVLGAFIVTAASGAVSDTATVAVGVAELRVSLGALPMPFGRRR